MRYLIVVLLLTGCMDAEKCKETCAPNPVQSVTPGGDCTCYIKEIADKQKEQAQKPYYQHERFCLSCSQSCGDKGMKTCKFGNDTWGAGPDICECNEIPDAGT